jgi:hypothetical protein
MADLRKIDLRVIIPLIGLVAAIFAGSLWRRSDVVFDSRAVEIPLSDSMRRSIEGALAGVASRSDSVGIAKNGQPVSSSPHLPSTKLPDKLLYVNIRNMGHVPSSKIKVHIAVPGEIADKDLRDAGSAFGTIDQIASADSSGELSFECLNLANDPRAKIRIALWYQRTKSDTPSIEIQDTSEGPAREVGSIETARFYWWDHVSLPLNVLFALLGASAMYLLTFSKWQSASRPNFTAFYESLACGWAQCSVSGEPAMQVFATVTVATAQAEPVEIIQAYLKGTQATGSLVSPIIAIKESSAIQTLNFTVQPVVGKSGKPYRGKIVLVDKHGNKYMSPRLEFRYRGSATGSLVSEGK